MIDGRSILLAGSDPYEALLLRAAFRKAGFENSIQVLTQEKEVVEYVKARGRYANRRRFPAPGFLLLDISLAKNSSARVFRQIKRSAMKRRIPVVMLGGACSGREAQGKEGGSGDYFLENATNFSELVCNVKHTCAVLLGGKRPAGRG